MLSYLKILKKSMVPQLFFIITLLTSGVIINLVQCILYLCLRPANKRMYKKINSYLCYTIYAQISWLAEWWANTNLILYMDKDEFKKIGKDHIVCIMNHTYEIDWLLALILSDRLRLLGNNKAYVKKSLQWIPVLGWAWKFSDFVLLERSFEKDKEVIQKQVKEIVEYPVPTVLLLYPEGTRFTQEKHKASEEFGRLHNMPSLKHHLHPRTRGFITSLPPMKGKVPAIYDILLTFKEDDPVKPTMLNILLGKSITAYMYIKRIPMEDLPNSEDELKKYCEDMYVRKDKLKESFVKTGDFFETSGIPKTPQIPITRQIYTLINMIFWAVVILNPMVYYILGLLFSGNPVHCAVGVGMIGMFMSLLYVGIRTTKKTKGSSYGIKNGSSHQLKLNK